MAWERFMDQRKRFHPKVSIHNNGQIALNIAAMENFKLKEYEYAVLFYDKEKKRIGIKVTNNKIEPGKCKLRIREKVGAIIGSTSFLTAYGLENYKGKSFELVWDQKEKMITFDLK